MKIFLTLMCGPGSLTDLKELWGPITPYIDGIGAVYFGSTSDPEFRYLESVKGGGKIICLPYVGRHDLARTVCVHNGAIEEGDWVMQFDTLERVPASFATTLRSFIPLLKQRGVNAAYYYGKIFLYEYHESIVFQGTPHEGFRRLDNNLKAVELNVSFNDESKVRLNVRPIKRPDRFHFVDHYLKYYVGQPWGSNHVLLGLEKNGDPQKLFPMRETRRLVFREYCRTKLGLALTADAIKAYMLEHQKDMPEDFKKFLREEKILNDAWRYHVLGCRDFTDDHDHKNMVEIS